MASFFLRSKHFQDFLFIEGQFSEEKILRSGWYLKRVSPTSCIVTPKPMRVTNKNQQKHFSSGYAFLSGEMVFYNELGFEDVWNEESVFGHFSSLKIFSDHVAAKCDAAGQERIFYYNSDKIKVITNRLHMASKILGLFGLSKVDKTAFYQQLGFTTYITNSYFSSNNTIVEGVRLLEPNCILYFDYRKGFKFVDCSKESVGEDYQYLLHKGIDELRNVFSAVGRGRNYSLNIEISGGKDSRLTLAAALASVDINKIRGRSYRTKSELDFPIAAAIQDYFSISPSVSPKFGFSMPITNEVAQEIQRSLFLGSYFLRHGLNSTTAGMNDDQVYFSGLGGNIFRNGAYGNLEQSFPNMEMMTAEEFANKFYDKYFLQPYFTDKGNSEQRSSWVSEFLSLKGDVVGEKLTSLHNMFTTRTHGGLVSEYTAWSSSLLINPLVQAPSLSKAAMLLSENERSEAKLFVDAIAEMKPELLDFPFDKSFSLADEFRKSRGMEHLIDVEYDTSIYEKKSREIQYGHQGAILMRYSTVNNDMTELYLADSNRIFESLLELGVFDESLIHHEKWKVHFDRICSRNPNLATRYAAMMMGALDVLK